MDNIIKFLSYPIIYLIKMIATVTSFVWIGMCLLVAIPIAIIGCIPAGLVVITCYLEKVNDNNKNKSENENETTENDLL